MPISRRTFIKVASSAAALSGMPRGAAAAGDDDPLGVRADFPIVHEGVYLNTAYIGPTPTPVVRAGQAFLEAKGVRPVPLGDMLAKREEVRGQFARLVNADPAEIAFLSATSDGENIVTRSLGLKPGDNIVVDDLHYTTTYVLYRQLERSAGIELRIAKQRDGAAPPEVFAPLVDDRTRLISVAWVSHQNGYHHDIAGLARLAHAHGAFLYADAIQAVGMIPIDVKALEIDFFTAGTYKWLLGGFGIAPFFVRRSLLDRIHPDRAGFLQVAKELPDQRFELFGDARKFEYATLAFDPLYQLGAALTYLERVGVDRIERHTVGLAHQLRRGLEARGFDVATPAGNRSSIVVFAGRKDLDASRGVLEAARVQVTVRENGRAVRVAPALFNNASDIETCLKAVEGLA